MAGSSNARLPTASRSPAHSPSLACRRAKWKSARSTNIIERSREEFKRRIKTRIVLPSADTAAMLFLAEFASGTCRPSKIGGWQPIDLD